MSNTKFWRSVEVLHDVVYFAPDSKARYEVLGLKGYWMGYFASRSAALGTPPPELVIATFHGFAPKMVRRALPDAWSLARRDDILKARFDLLGLKGYWMGYFASRSAALGTPPPELVIATFHGFAPKMVRRALPDAWSLASRDDILKARFDLARDALAPGIGAAEVDTGKVAKELTAIVDGLDFAGKPLAAAHASLEKPTDDIGLLWWAASVIREYRGDCHLAVLGAAGLNGTSANTLAVAAGLTVGEQRTMRGWTEEEWAAGYAELAGRGWVDAEGTITDSGASARKQIEDATDRVCYAGMDKAATGRSITVEDSVRALARAVLKSGAIAFPNPTGVKPPE